MFLISGGLTYEMAPKTWSAIEDPPIEDRGIAWCSDTSSNITGAVGTAIGTGSANTTAMQSDACSSGAGISARAYRGGGFSDWFLPSKDELNAMCNYSRNPTAPAAPSVSCFGSAGSQDGTFAGGAYGFVEDGYWSSSQDSRGHPNDGGWVQGLGEVSQFVELKNATARVRPIRAF
ncbi:hypothetical protein LBMAG15_09400 [Actinomycetes bacterium]|nr:hypothetical protein LBMAG15_09400 [Actinomycetes bacterium]